MTVKPLHDRVLVKPDEVKEQTDKGLLLSDSGQKRPSTGTVVVVGPGPSINGVPMTVKDGDKVSYREGAGTELPVDGEKYLIMPESEILAIL